MTDVRIWQRVLDREYIEAAPLKVKDVLHHGPRYMVCLNKDQTQQDAAATEMPSLLH